MSRTGQPVVGGIAVDLQDACHTHRDAGVKPTGKSGSHIFRHARAVEMLRAAVPQKVIGDPLGHRSAESTAP